MLLRIIGPRDMYISISRALALYLSTVSLPVLYSYTLRDTNHDAYPQFVAHDFGF